MKTTMLVRILIMLLVGLFVIQSCKTPEKSQSRRKKSTVSKTLVMPDTTAAFYERMSQRLGIPLGGDENPRLLAAVDSWMNVPYRYGGQDKKGTDCSGLANAIYLEVYETVLPRSSIDIMNSSIAVKLENLKEGDLVFFTISGTKVNHVGVYLSNGYFVHATTRKGVMISSLNEAYYRKHYTVAGRLLQ